MAQQTKPIHGPQGGRGRPRPKLENPGATLARVLKFVGKHYGIHMVLVVVCIFVTVFSSVQGTLFTQTLIDDYILPMVKAVGAGGAADFGPLLLAMGRVAIFYGCGILASFCQARLMVYVTQGTLRNLRDAMFLRMQKLPVKYFTELLWQALEPAEKEEA